MNPRLLRAKDSRSLTGLQHTYLVGSAWGVTGKVQGPHHAVSLNGGTSASGIGVRMLTGRRCGLLTEADIGGCQGRSGFPGSPYRPDAPVGSLRGAAERVATSALASRLCKRNCKRTERHRLILIMTSWNNWKRNGLFGTRLVTA